MSNWISVKERLPKGGDISDQICENVVLLLSEEYEENYVTIGWMNGLLGKVFFIPDYDDEIREADISIVKAWMPLPAPPKGTAEYVRQDHHLPHGSLEPHITNGDRIRMMTDEELAEWLSNVLNENSVSGGLCPQTIEFSRNCYKNNTDCNDKICIMAWLMKEVDK